MSFIEQWMNYREPTDPRLTQRTNQLFTMPAPEQMAQVEQVMPRLDPEKTYTPRSLLEDPEAMKSIRLYMSGFHRVTEETSDEDLIEMYLAKMRKFSAGQSVVTGNEFFQLQRADDDKKAIAGQAYDIFDRLEGMWSEEYTPGETFGALGTYIRSVVIDPTNLVGLFIGRAVSGGATKAASAGLRMVAKEAAAKATEAALKSGATQTAALAAGQAAAKNVAQKSAQSAALNSAIKRDAFKSVAAATAVDAALALGVDAAYQSSLIETGRQEEWSPFSSGLSVLGALGAGALDLGLRGTSKAVDRIVGSEIEGVSKLNMMSLPASRIVTQAQIKASNLDQFNVAIDDLFSEKVARGENLVSPNRIDKENDLWKGFLLGVDGEHSGLVHALQTSNFRFLPARYPGDNFSNQMGDFLNQLPEDSQNKIVDAFHRYSGGNYKDIDDIGDLVDLISFNVHQSAVDMNIRSQMARQLGVQVIDDIPVSDVMKGIFDIPLEKAVRNGGATLMDRVQYLQSSLIQSIVAHPATTALNVIGTSYRTGADTLSDVVRGALNTTAGAKGFLTGDLKQFNRGVGTLKAVAQRPGQWLRPEATMNEAIEYMEARPEVREALFRYISGGVERSKEIMDTYGIDPNAPWVRGIEGFKKLSSDLFWVQGQDRFFKTQLFMNALDRRLLEETGMNYQQFMNRSVDDIVLDMNSERYARLEFGAVEDALKGTFSKSYSDRASQPASHFGRAVNKAASTIEDLRRWPIIGATMPFGQFFNNTLDMMADYSGAKFLWRLGHGASGDDKIDAFARGAVGWSTVAAMSQAEMGYIDEGLSWNEERSSDGDIVTKTYDFPESMFKMAARMLAHYRKEEEVPPDLWAEAFKTFGLEGFTRNFNQTISGIGESSGEALGEIARDPTPATILKEFANVMMENVGAAWVSGFTRPLDPVNQMVGALKEDGMTVYDRKTGVEALNNSFRYLDQIVGSFLEDQGTQERNPVFPSEEIQTVGRLTGYRTVPGESDAQRMFNAVGRPYFMNDLRNSEIPEAINLIRREFMTVLEEKATALVTGPYWKQSDQASKRRNVQSVLSEARTEAVRRVRNSMVVEDQHMAALFDLYQDSGTADVDRAFRDLGFSENYKDVTELDAYQIRQLAIRAKDMERQDKLAPFVPGRQ